MVIKLQFNSHRNFILNLSITLQGLPLLFGQIIRNRNLKCYYLISFGPRILIALLLFGGPKYVEAAAFDHHLLIMLCSRLYFDLFCSVYRLDIDRSSEDGLGNRDGPVAQNVVAFSFVFGVGPHHDVHDEVAAFPV